MAEPISDWPRRIVLGEYDALFAEQRIDREVLPDLTDGNLIFMQADGSNQAGLAEYERALNIARQAGAKSLQLRVATSLARRLREEDRCDEALELLAPIHDWFTEGFDTADLKAARLVLEALS